MVVSSWGPVSPLPLIRNATYELNEAEGAEVVTLWQQLRDPNVRTRESLATAIRRFGYAGERERTEDRFVDLMVAAEAMFLGEQRDTTELSYRLSSRFAYFVDVPGMTRRSRYEHMRRAYRARSRVLHGDRPTGMRTAAEFDAFTSQTADYLRFALRALIDEALRVPGRKELVDWDALTIGPQTAGDARTDVEEE
jgi:hypothetical protein